MDREEKNAYMAEYMRKRYHRRRAQVIERLGGKCATCGDTKGLEADHLVRDGKVANISALINKSNKHLEAELLKCQLLCRVCHEGKTSRENSVPHGGGLSGKRNCKCLPCKARKSEYQRNWYQQRFRSSDGRAPSS